MFIQALNFHALMGSYFLLIFMSFIQQKNYKLRMFSVTLKKKKKDNRLPRVLALRMFYRQRFLFFFMVGMQLMLPMVEKGTWLHSFLDSDFSHTL